MSINTFRLVRTMYDTNWINKVISEIKFKPHHEDYMISRYTIRKPRTCYKLKLKVINSLIIRKIRQKQRKEIKEKIIWFRDNKSPFVSNGEKILRQVISNLFPNQYLIYNDRIELNLL